MNFLKYSRIAISILFFVFINTANANTEFFASNNTDEIDLQTALKRLNGVEQKNLQTIIGAVMEENHIQQEKTENVLGVYLMSSHQHITADNTEIFSTQQKLANNKVFSIAQQLALKLNQESVAVFIPAAEHKIGDITVSFSSHPLSIDEIINLIHKKLPEKYSQAFSLHLVKKLNQEKVMAIEWLGNKSDVSELEQVFAVKNITYHYGKGFLIYKDGKVSEL